MLGDLLSELRYTAKQIPRCVASAHGLGYDADGIKGNVVRCRQALAHADMCLGLVSRMPSRRLPKWAQRNLFQVTVHLRNDMILWIALLRQQFV